MKTVAITQRVDIIEAYNEQRDSLDIKWGELFTTLDAIIFPVPNQIAILSTFLETITPDAIILTGGDSSVEYGGRFINRDVTDNFLIRYAINYDIPLMGVCRGMQSIVSFFGGTLKKINKHIAIQHQLTGVINREVNSFHSLGIKTLPAELLPLSYSTDGTIEHIKHKIYKITAIMWHPERENPFKLKDLDLIKKELEL
ncbi:MAG: hypothetical protein BEN19_08265 [Epulopiscium sp. Nuni2H_MBin003]|nr:MAG: hypothetical protein BEN19_08265 [Epulopiscium sp. Nuni2H_MBin003]